MTVFQRIKRVLFTRWTITQEKEIRMRIYSAYELGQHWGRKGAALGMQQEIEQSRKEMVRRGAEVADYRAQLEQADAVILSMRQELVLANGRIHSLELEIDRLDRRGNC